MKGASMTTGFQVRRITAQKEGYGYHPGKHAGQDQERAGDGVRLMGRRQSPCVDHRLDCTRSSSRPGIFRAPGDAMGVLQLRFSAPASGNAVRFLSETAKSVFRLGLALFAD